MEHLRTVVAGAAARHGVRRDDPREADRPEVHGELHPIRRELAVVMGVVVPEVLAGDLVAAVHGVRLEEPILFDRSRGGLGVEIGQSVGRDRTRKEELDGMTVVRGLLRRDLQQVQRAPDVDPVGDLRHELASGREQGREVVDRTDLVGREQSLQHLLVADVTGERFVAQASMRLRKFPKVDRDHRRERLARGRPFAALAREGLEKPVAHLATGAGHEDRGIAARPTERGACGDGVGSATRRVRRKREVHLRILAGSSRSARFGTATASPFQVAVVEQVVRRFQGITPSTTASPQVPVIPAKHSPPPTNAVPSRNQGSINAARIVKATIIAPAAI